MTWSMAPCKSSTQKPLNLDASVWSCLSKKELIFESTDALDVTRFVRDFLPGAIPIPGQPGVYKPLNVGLRDSHVVPFPEPMAPHRIALARSYQL